MKKIIKDIQTWSYEKGLYKTNSFKQFAKHCEESKELIQAETNEDLILELGDNVVTITVLAQQQGFNILHCRDLVGDDPVDNNIAVLNGDIAESLCKRIGISKALGRYFKFLENEAYMNNLQLKICARAAYAKITNRDGKMVDGIYTKMEDIR